MFFGLEAVDDHPCCKMQELVEEFFQNAIDDGTFTEDLFPDWIHDTLGNPTCTLNEGFEKIHALLHENGRDRDFRQAVYEQLLGTNRIAELCDGTADVPVDVFNWEHQLGKAIAALMGRLYQSLDLAVFKQFGGKKKPTHELYYEFIKKNKYVCPFCGLDRFKNREGIRREDFDHYLPKSIFPLAAANMKNLIPTCGTCNQDYKKSKNLLDDGFAFYPYGNIPKVKIEIDCSEYPATDNFSDFGQWSVNLSLEIPDAENELKMAAWDRVYSIKKRLENEILEFSEDWMMEVADEQDEEIDEETYSLLIKKARDKAIKSKERRRQPSQIIRAAFYDFILAKTDEAFVKSFLHLQNQMIAQ